MPKIINCVVDTYSKKEREKLVDFICERIKPSSFLDDYDGFQLMVVHNGIVGNVGAISARYLVEIENYLHFLSVDSFEEYHIRQEIGDTRYEIYEKYGIKPTIVHKTGAITIIPAKRFVKAKNNKNI